MNQEPTNNRPKVVITGASRGIGLALARKYALSGFDVIAGARNPDGARGLWELEHDYPQRVRTLELDVASESSIHAFKGAIGTSPIDILINNAGVLPDPGVPFEDVKADAMLKAFTVNVLGPLRVTQTLLANLQASARPTVAIISSKMGSLADNSSGGYYAYRVSKTAVNMLATSLAKDFAQLKVVLLHPGWVQTEMGGSGAQISVEESAEGLHGVINGLDIKDSGSFLDFRGQKLPW